MNAGPCAGVTGTGDCVAVGWSPQYLCTQTNWDGIVAGLLSSPDEIVCPWCLMERAVNAKVPGFNRQKVNRLSVILNGWNCQRPTRSDLAEGSRSTGHTHLIDWQAESQSWRDEPPAPGEQWW